MNFQLPMQSVTYLESQRLLNLEAVPILSTGSSHPNDQEEVQKGVKSYAWRCMGNGYVVRFKFKHLTLDLVKNVFKSPMVTDLYPIRNAKMYGSIDQDRSFLLS
jgi:hypothetical protein